MVIIDNILESRSSQVNFPHTRHIKVLETVIENPTKVRSVGLTYVPVQLEPCIVLRGKWLREAGFAPDQKVTVTVEYNSVTITVKGSAVAPKAEG